MAAVPESSSPMIPQEAALQVVKGAIGTALAGTAFGSLYGLAKGYAATPLAFQGGANAFVFAFPFFALREYVVLPMLANDFYDAKPSMHTKNVGASAISGAIVGGGLSAYFRGPQKLLPGLTTFAVLCTSMQLLGNELRVLRVHMLTERDEAPDAVGSATQTLPSLREAHAASLPVDAPPQPVESAASTDSDWLGWIGSYLVSLSPVRKVSDGEYQEQLQTRRRRVLEKLREVENGIAREEAAAQKQV